MLLTLIAPALAATTLVAVLHALVSIYWRGDGERSDEPPPTEFRNPFSFWPVVGFAILSWHCDCAGTRNRGGLRRWRLRC
jgi:hypothetical protein